MANKGGGGKKEGKTPTRSKKAKQREERRQKQQQKQERREETKSAEVLTKKEKAKDAETGKEAKKVAKERSPERKGGREKTVREPKGLPNLGNTCFFNSTMQCLLSNFHVIQRYIGEVSNRTEIPPSTVNVGEIQVPSIMLRDSPMPTFWAFYNFAKDYDERRANPRSLFDQISKRVPRFRGWHQQDAHELLRYLMDMLRQEEVNRLQRGVEEAKANENDGEKIQNGGEKAEGEKRGRKEATEAKLRKNANGGGEGEKAREKERNRLVCRALLEGPARPMLDTIYGGTLQQTITCQRCGNVSVSLEPFFDLSLPLKSNQILQPHFEPAKAPSLKTDTEENGNTTERKPKGKGKKRMEQQREKAKRKEQKMDADCEGIKEDEEKKDNDNGDQTADVTFDKEKAMEEKEVKEGDDNKSKLLTNGTNCDGIDAYGQQHQDGDGIVVESLNQTLAEVNGDGEQHQDGDGIVVESLTRTLAEVNGDGEQHQDGDGIVGESLTQTLAEVNGDGEQHQDGDGIVVESLTRTLAEVNGDVDGIAAEVREGEEPGEKEGRDGQLSLERALSAFTGEERLMSQTHAYRCEKCHAEAKKLEEKPPPPAGALKRYLILTPPLVLTLHLKRFEQLNARGLMRKFNAHVVFPELFNLAPFCSEFVKRIYPGQRRLLYRLYGIVSHSGGMSGGHYVAYVRRNTTFDQQQFDKVLELARFTGSSCSSPVDQAEQLAQKMRSLSLRGKRDDNYQPNDLEKPQKLEIKAIDAFGKSNDQSNWFYCSDLFVSNASIERVLSAQAYMLFYERIY